MNTVLGGARIVITRPAGQADSLRRLIESQGGAPILFPLLGIEPLPPPPPAALAQALQSDWLIFTSANAVDYALQAFGDAKPAAGRPAVAAVGGTTAGRLRQAGWPVQCVPAENFSSEGLLAEEAFRAPAGQNIVIVRGASGRELIADALRQRGAEISYLELYRRTKPKPDVGGLAELRNSAHAAIIITSNEALQNLSALLDPELFNAIRAVPLVTASARIARIAEQQGFIRIITSRNATDAAILETLTTIFNGENSGRTN